MVAKPSCSPGTQLLRLADGRDLAWCERGVATGTPVFVFHGLPGSRLQQHPDESIAASLNARLIFTDRPGFGRSAPQANRSLSGWPRDIAALADHLQIEKFSLVGVSGGGPSACACCAQLGNRITRAAIVSSVGPPGSMAGNMHWLARFGFSIAPGASWALRMPVAMSANIIAHAPEQFIDLVAMQMPRIDKQILARPEVRSMMIADLRECFRQGSRGFTDDLQVTASDWPIDFGHVTCETRLWHGSEDSLIPASTMRYIASRISNAQTTLLDGEGHYLVIDRWREILGWVVERERDKVTK